MRRFSKRRGPFRGTQRRERFWVPFYNPDLGSGASITEYTVPQLVQRITPQGSVPDYTSMDNTGFYGQLQGQKLLMFQGGLYAQLRLNDRAAEDWLSARGSREVPQVHMFYMWLKTRGANNYAEADGDLQPDTLTTGKYAWSPAPGPVGNLYRMMTRKDVIRWGFITLTPSNMLGSQWTYNGTGATAYNWPIDPHFRPAGLTRIPLPRIGRAGFSFAPGDELRCYASLVPWDMYVGGHNFQPLTLYEDESEPSGSVQCFSFFRGLFAK